MGKEIDENYGMGSSICVEPNPEPCAVHMKDTYGRFFFAYKRNSQHT